MSINYRQDDRSREVFADNLKQSHIKEAIWSLVLQADHEDRGRPCEVEWNGVDCTGEVIEGSIGHHDADWKFTFESGEVRLIEIKTIPEWCTEFCTFKVTSLQACVADGAWICVPRFASYCMYSPEACRRLLRFEARIYKGFSPNDPAVRFYASTTAELMEAGLVECHGWQATARAIIERNHATLFEEKRK